MKAQCTNSVENSVKNMDTASIENNEHMELPGNASK